ISGGGFATVGVWQHIVATYDGTTILLYVDGVLRGSLVALPGWAPNTQMAIRMGNQSLTGNYSDGPAISSIGNTGNRGWDGWLDEVAIYPTALTAAQVAAHHDAASTNNAGYQAQIIADGPVGYWPLDEATVTAPDPSTFPIAANSGSAGSAANATNMWGALAGQSDL